MSDKWDKFLRNLMEDDSELDELEFVDPDLILEEVNNDPELRDVKAPEDLHDRVFAQIREYEEQKRLAALSDEDKELLRLGKIYRKRLSRRKYVVLAAALVAVFAIGTVSFGEKENVLSFFERVFSGGEEVVTDSGSIEPVKYIDEEEVLRKIEDTYDIDPIELEYLPQKTTFQEADFYEDMQEVYLYYGVGDEASIIYTIKPNFRESSYSTVVEDQKKQEYTLCVEDTDVLVKEYAITDSSMNRWCASWVFQDVQYVLNITDMEQSDVELIINNLKLYE